MSDAPAPAAPPVVTPPAVTQTDVSAVPAQAPPPLAPPPSAPPPSIPPDLKMSDEIVIKGEDGREQAVTVGSLLDNHRKYNDLKMAYNEAATGDAVAIERYLKVVGEFTGVRPTMPQSPQVPAATPPPAPQSDQVLTPEEASAIKNYISTQRANDVRQHLTQRLQGPEYTHLAVRPDAVDQIILDLNSLHERKIAVSDETIKHVMTQLNEREKAYQDKIITSLQADAGVLGVNEPFRSGPPEALITERPNAYTEPDKYKKYLGQKFRAAMGTASSDRETAAGNIFGL